MTVFISGLSPESCGESQGTAPSGQDRGLPSFCQGKHLSGKGGRGCAGPLLEAQGASREVMAAWGLLDEG